MGSHRQLCKCVCTLQGYEDFFFNTHRVLSSGLQTIKAIVNIETPHVTLGEESFDQLYIPNIEKLKADIVL